MNKLFVFAMSAAICVFAAKPNSVSGDVMISGNSMSGAYDLSQGLLAGPLESIYGKGGFGVQVTGDTYDIRALAQSSAGAAYISTNAVATQTFNSGSGKHHGENVLYNIIGQPGTNFVVSESLTNLGSGNWELSVEMTSVGPNGPNPWVPTGISIGGQPPTAWRMDLGAFTAATLNRLTPSGTWSQIGTGTMALFNSSLIPIFSGPINNEVSDATGFAGAGIVGLGGAPIGGADVASFQFRWTYNVVPEPSSLMMVSIVAFGLVRRRRR